MITITIQERGIEDIFRLPCVRGIMKDGKGKPAFSVTKSDGSTVIARCGSRLNIQGDKLISID